MKSIIIRNMPEELHRAIKTAAAQSRKTINQLLLDTLNGIMGK